MSLAQKYPHLEISVLKLSDVLHDNPTKRMDAEYFKGEWVENGEKVQSPYTIGDFVSPKIANIKSFKLNKNFHYLQISDIDLSNGLTYPTMEIDFKQIPDRATYVLQKNDVCVSLVRPNRNAVALITRPKRLVGTSGFCVLRVASQELIPEFLYVFCKTNFFITQMVRANTASMYPAILDRDVLNCKIPLLPLPFQEHIAQLVQSAHHALEQSKSLYKEAQGLLEQELGALPSAPLTEHSIKTLKESFLSTGRLDAEFYQHKYAQIEDLIKNYSGGVCTLTESEICDAPFEPQPNTTYRYVELAHIGNYGNIATHTEALGAHLPTRARRLAQSGDVLLSSVAGSLSACALIPPNLSPCVVSTGFFILRSRHFNPETLLTLFKSPLFQTYLAKFSSGTILCAISKSALQSVLIPKIPTPTQEHIATLLQESLKHRQEAKDLLTQARATTEHALTGGGGG
ncbi:restriction endonuclease subunit S [Helicobacter cynogastricus]|uniref:restriction endonuclease subunit S n=1 Tax=Helicobacter cynogastricus TaxID=329937 RepID=UPI000CF01691|nr:restriction endonuclease subunit S [Helicobacter cynogastricus]